MKDNIGKNGKGIIQEMNGPREKDKDKKSKNPTVKEAVSKSEKNSKKK